MATKEAFLSQETQSYLDTYIEQLQALPYHRFLGFEVRRHGQGTAASIMRVQAQMFEDGIVDEGAMTTLGVQTAKVAIMSLMGSGRDVVILEHQMSVMAHAQVRRLVTKARVDYWRARLARALYEIRDSQGELVARGNLMAYILPREEKKSEPQKLASEDDPFDVKTIVEEDPDLPY